MPNSIRFILAESAECYLWDRLFPLENETTAKDFLRKKYTAAGIELAEQKAFRNATALVYYVRQAKSFFQPGNEIPFQIQPLLLYYGMMNLFKAWVLTFDLNYPQNTSVLRHGLSTKKRKKSRFRFMQDEVRVQKEGLFPLLLEQFPHTTISAGDLFVIEDLLSFLPDLQSEMETKHQTLWPIQLGNVEEQGMVWSLPESILDQLHLTPSSFLERLNRANTIPFFRIDNNKDQSQSLSMLWSHPQIKHVNDWGNGFDHPWFYENKKGDYYLWIGSDRLSEPVPEVLAQYMILFTLSMLCRYDPPLWGEVLDGYTSDDMIYIQKLLPLVKRKFPNLLLNLLEDEKIVIHIH